MKNIFKNILKVTLICLFFAISSCEKDLYDESINQSNETKAKLLTSEQTKIISERLTQTMRNSHHTVNNIAQNKISITSIGTIRYDRVLQIIENGKSTYTFKVDHPDSSISKFYNLVFEEKTDGNIVKLLEYTMTPEFAQLFSETFNYKDFKGTVSSYTIVNETPCPDEDLILINIGPVGGSTGGGGTGGGGTGGGGTGGGGTGGGGTGGGAVPIDYEPEAIVIITNPEEEDWDEVSESPRYFKVDIKQPNGISIIEDAPCSPNIHFGLLTPYTKCEKDFMSASSERLWLYQNQASQEYTELMQYINGDGSGECSTERENVANELIRDIKRGSKIDFVNKVIIDSSFVNNQKAMCVYTKMRTMNAFNKALEPFEESNPKAFLKLETKNLGPEVRAETTEPNGNNIITISLNDNVISNGISEEPNLLIAQTIIHEVIHAEFFRQIMEAVSVGSYVVDYDVIVNALRTSQYSRLSEYCRIHSDWSHNYMAEKYRRAIARVTQEFATNLPVASDAIPDAFYTNLAWRGLDEYDVVAWTNMSSGAQADVYATIDNYLSLNSNQTCE